MIGLLMTESGMVSARDEDDGDWRFVELGATPGSARMTWWPPQPVVKTAAAAAKNGARFN
jgi:hypothetical protein